MEFPASLDGFNEADVREEIIAPLLRHFGYRARSCANIIREQSLRYPREFLGRKNPHRDPPLRGRADYILDVDGLVRWTIEAKPPSAPISTDDVEQAYSYARHPEVRAVYFALMNGAEFRVYQTDRAPDAPPLLTVFYADLPAATVRLENLLGPNAIRRDFPLVTPDVGQPIGPGLRSLVRIVSGIVEFQESEPAAPLLREISLFVTDGAIEHDVDGTLMLHAEAQSPFRSINRFNERMRLSRLALTSPDTVLSTSAESPTVFQQDLRVTVPAGETFPNLMAEEEFILHRNLDCRSTTVARGILKANRFVGRFRQRYEYIHVPDIGESSVINASGQFETVLA